MREGLHRGSREEDIVTQQNLWASIKQIPPESDGERLLPPVTAYSQRFHRSPNWVGATLKKWERDGKIEHRTTGKARSLKHYVRILNGAAEQAEIARRVPTAVVPRVDSLDPEGRGPLTEEEKTQSTKDALLELLKKEANPKGILMVGPEFLRRRLGLGMHDLHKFLFDLKAQGLVEVKSHHGEITNIRVRPLGILPAPMRTMEETLGPGTAASIDTPGEADAPTEPGAASESSVGYPIISRLLKRRSKILEASRLLEEAGLDDESLVVLAKADEVAPLEAEILRMVEEHGLSASFQEAAGPEDHSR